jgi:hypothetical protein
MTKTRHATDVANNQCRLAMAEQLRRAARIIEKQLAANDLEVDGMCSAISSASPRGNTHLAQRYITHMYYPSCQRSNHAWWYAAPYREMDARATALYFAADVLESGGMP